MFSRGQDSGASASAPRLPLAHLLPHLTAVMRDVDVDKTHFWRVGQNIMLLPRVRWMSDVQAGLASRYLSLIRHITHLEGRAISETNQPWNCFMKQLSALGSFPAAPTRWNFLSHPTTQR